MHIQERYLENISENIRRGVPAGFTGLGIILIAGALGELPISPLLSEGDCYPGVQDDDAITEFLFEISSIKDKRHDGFHVISQEGGLLKISQYFSPLIPVDFNETIFNVGARYRAAQYGSLYQCVSSIIVVSQKGEISIAKNGVVRSITI